MRMVFRVQEGYFEVGKRTVDDAVAFNNVFPDGMIAVTTKSLVGVPNGRLRDVLPVQRPVPVPGKCVSLVD